MTRCCEHGNEPLGSILGEELYFRALATLSGSIQIMAYKMSASCADIETSVHT